MSTRMSPLAWAEGAALGLPAVLKLLKMATGMRALLDTVVQALPQVRAAASSGPSCLLLVPCWALGDTGPDFPSP